ncbi:MAG: hypothetical protein KME29_40310 [Calothrix sp. FI2-JRJ7]|jgi:hypothetical protein|nr:hypothetical protein [Calothrix sp. FI2-JRJ7]
MQNQIHQANKQEDNKDVSLNWFTLDISEISQTITYSGFTLKKRGELRRLKETLQ